MTSIRQLAAILFVDIVGYTAMMQEDETLALELVLKFKKKLEEEVTLHKGRILEFMGDGALCSFTSTLECVQAALALQLDMQSDPVVPLRAGIHTGDVIIQGDSIYGDGVNIASRMQSMAVPGSILISGKVHDDIKNQKDIQTIPLGKFILKNVKEHVVLFAISNAGIVVPDPTKLEGKGEKVLQRCILVLPFVNMSNDPDQEYFSDGLTEELISNLSRLKNMRVISRTTSMKYKGTNKDTKTIGIEAEAGYIVEGSVRKSGNDLRITAQFVDAVRDIHLWANTYRGSLDDIFDIQEKVSAKIVEALRLQLTENDMDILQKRYTENTDAYQLYLQGRFFWSKRTEEGLKKALRFFENAIVLDPDYALAWVGIADTYSLLGEFTDVSRRELHPKAKEAINKALKIDSQLAEAHVSRGLLIMLNEWDWVGAENEFRIGIELNPNYATGHQWYSELLLYTGRSGEAHREIVRAVELDPVSQAILKDYGIHYYYTRQYEKAIERSKKTLELDPDFTSVHRLLSLCYQGLGMYEEAIEENTKWGNFPGNELKTKLALAQIYGVSGNRDQAFELLNDILTNHVLFGNDYRSVALIYASLGENDKAFEWLDQSIQRHEESLCSMKVDPKFDPIRDDIRFKTYLKKIGL